MQLVKIYKLIDPRDGCVFYVGATRRELSVRLKGHSNRERIKEINLAGLSPIITIIDEVKPSIASEVEWAWIEKYRSWGYALENGINRTSYCMSYKMKDPIEILDANHQPTMGLYRAFSPGYFRQLTFTEDLIDSEQWDFFKSFCKQELGKDWEYEPTTYVDDLTSIGHYELKGYQFITLPKNQAA